MVAHDRVRNCFSAGLCNSTSFKKNTDIRIAPARPTSRGELSAASSSVSGLQCRFANTEVLSRKKQMVPCAY